MFDEIGDLCYVGYIGMVIKVCMEGEDVGELIDYLMLVVKFDVWIWFWDLIGVFDVDWDLVMEYLFGVVF